MYIFYFVVEKQYIPGKNVICPFLGFNLELKINKKIFHTYILPFTPQKISPGLSPFVSMSPSALPILQCTVFSLHLIIKKKLLQVLLPVLTPLVYFHL